MHALTYIDDEAKRRRILNQLNKGEDRHKLARAVFHGKQGELRQRYREGQEDQLGALGLVVNMIVLWNTLYLAKRPRPTKQFNTARQPRVEPFAYSATSSAVCAVVSKNSKTRLRVATSMVRGGANAQANCIILSGEFGFGVIHLRD